MKKTKYFKADLKRVFMSGRPIIAIGGVAFALFLSIYRMMDIEISVYHVYLEAIYFIPFILSLTFCALPFAGTICEDIEYGYMRIAVLRGELKKYVGAKVLMIYLSSILTMILGTIIFILLVHMKVPWMNEEDILYHDVFTNIFLKSQHYVLFFSSYAFSLGLLSGNLSILATFISLFWPNRLLVLSVPFIAYYLQIYYGGAIFKGIPQLDISQMFNPSNNVWNNPIVSAVWPLFISILFGGCLGVCIYKTLKRRI